MRNCFDSMSKQRYDLLEVKLVIFCNIVCDVGCIIFYYCYVLCCPKNSGNSFQTVGQMSMHWILYDVRVIKTQLSFGTGTFLFPSNSMYA